MIRFNVVCLSLTRHSCIFTQRHEFEYNTTVLSIKDVTYPKAQDRVAKMNIEFTIPESAVVCNDIVIEGEYSVRIGEGTIIHPRSCLKATKGPIIIGANNVIEEFVTIENVTGGLLSTGEDNYFEVGASVFSNQVGDANVFEKKSTVTNCSIGSGCVIGTFVQLENEKIDDEIVVVMVTPRNRPADEATIYQRYRKGQKDRNSAQIQLFQQVLKTKLPKFHKLRG